MKRQSKLRIAIFVLIKFLDNQLLKKRYSVKSDSKCVIDCFTVIMELFLLMDKQAQARHILFLANNQSKTMV